MKKNGALIVTYNPNISILKKNIDAIKSQVMTVLIVDNNSSNIDEIREINNVILINNVENLGIATALNVGINYFYENSYEWVLTLDQDSICPNNLISTFDKYIAEDVGILCPAIKYNGWSSLSNRYSDVCIPVKACMTSASYTNVLAWKSVGGFDDSYFIDYVDNEFCMRLKINQYSIIRITTVELEHNLGVCGEKYLFGVIPIRYCLHNPIRYYYMVRNMLYFNITYKKFLNILKEYIKLLLMIVSALYWEKEKKLVLFYIKQGIIDARKHKYGKFNEKLGER